MKDKDKRSRDDDETTWKNLPGQLAGEASNLKPIYWIVLGLGVLMLVGYFVWDYLATDRPSPGKLADQALVAGDSPEQKKARLKAVSGLTMFPDKKAALPHLERVVKESKDPEVAIIALHGLVAYLNTDSIPLFIERLDDPEKAVRFAAYEDLKRFYSGTLPNDIKYNVDDPPANRSKVINQLQNYQKEKKKGIHDLDPTTK